ncbi:hypothetical protein FQR65_LT18993 [Abscondita terminalis]|nr:hypothetical protein FQR65_LT18993 [Abscondita terminalis]
MRADTSASYSLASSPITEPPALPFASRRTSRCCQVGGSGEGREMDKDNIPRQGRRSRGRPPKRWADDIKLTSLHFKTRTERRGSNSKPGSFKIKYEGVSRSSSFKGKNELCSCPSPGSVEEKLEEAVKISTGHTETICVTLTYKPRI